MTQHYKQKLDSTDIGQRIHPRAVYINLEMTMGSGGISGASDEGYRLSLLHLLPNGYQKLAAMRVQRARTVRVTCA